MSDSPQNKVTLIDVDVPFLRLVFFFVKAGLAVIPAAIIVGLVLILFSHLLRAVLGFGFFGAGARLYL